MAFEGKLPRSSWTGSEPGGSTALCKEIKAIKREKDMVCYDPRHDLMYCSCGNTDRLDGFLPLTDFSGLGRIRLFVLDWLVRLRVVPVGVASPVFTCICGTVSCITPSKLRIAENFRRKLEHAWGAASWPMPNKSKAQVIREAQLDRAHAKVRDILSVPPKNECIVFRKMNSNFRERKLQHVTDGDYSPPAA